MRLPRPRFTVRRLMVAVAFAACLIGAGVAFSVKPVTQGSVLTGWASTYCLPVFIILTRRVSLKSAAILSGKIVLFGLPGACLFALILFAMIGFVGLAGGFVLAVLVLGWVALLVSALMTFRPVMDEV